MSADPWTDLLSGVLEEEDDPWTRWDVEWEDVSKPVAEAVRLLDEMGVPDAEIEGHACAVCGGSLERDTWTVHVIAGRYALTHQGRFWARCYGR